MRSRAGPSEARRHAPGPRGRVARLVALLSALFAAVAAGCAAPDDAGWTRSAAHLVHEQSLARPLDDAQACLIQALASAPPVEGLLPVVLHTADAQGPRIEQWFIAPLTHQRTTFTLAPLAPDRTRVAVYLLQRHGQYEVAGFRQAALAAVARGAPDHPSDPVSPRVSD